MLNYATQTERVRALLRHKAHSILTMLMFAGTSVSQAAPPGLPPSDVALTVDGPNLVDELGQVVTLRTINLGNWFLIEPWLYGQDGSLVHDQATFFTTLRNRFGQENADHLIGLHRDNWITQRDFDMVAAAGFNCVRLPIHFSLLEKTPFIYDQDGFDRLKNVVEMADQSGLYVILDMHGAPGGQSLDQPSGDSTMNDLWTDAEAQERFAWLWQHIARRFKNARNVVAYDLLNEPYGDFSSDISAELIEILDRTIHVIRQVDEERLVYVPGTLGGIRFYGSLEDRGWTNAGFTEHFYPGLFDSSEPTLGTHAHFLATTLRERAEYTQSLNAPYLWGELNPVLDQAGAPFSTRELLDTAEELGLSAAVWTYKQYSHDGRVGSSNWYLVTNGSPLGVGDITRTSYAQLEAAFQGLATSPLAVDQEYLNALTTDNPTSVLPGIELPPMHAPASDSWTGWTIMDVGNVDRPGGQRVENGSFLSADHLTLYAPGQDLYNNYDSLRMAVRQPASNYTVSGVLEHYEGNMYAHAGVTLRASADANAPHVTLFAHPNGRVLVKSRQSYGSNTSQRYIATTGFPIGLAIGKSNGSVVAWCTNADGEWTAVPITETPNLGSAPLAGFFGLPNRTAPLSVIDFDRPRIDMPGNLADPPSLDAGQNLLFNGSFESSLSNGSAAGWATYGGNITRETGWSPVRDGSALLAYRHWEVSNTQPSGAYQELIGLVPGQQYVFTVYANRDDVSANQLADQLELRVETISSPTMRLESSFHGVSEIATGEEWSRVQLRFTATDTRHRVSIVMYPGSGTRDGAVKFDGVRLETN